MNPNEQEFFDLAMKVVAGHASASEQAELRALLADDPALKAEFERLRMDAELAKEVVPLIEATQATGPKLPEYARERLRAKVRQSLGHKRTEARHSGQWRWWLGLATATAAVVLVVVLNRPGPNLPPVVQVAMLDSVGTVRGTGEKPMDVLQRQWKEAKPQEFDDAAKLKLWQENWPAGSKQTVVKILYDRDAGEVRVMVRIEGKEPSIKVIPVKEERDLASVLATVEANINGLLKR